MRIVASSQSWSLPRHWRQWELTKAFVWYEKGAVRERIEAVAHRRAGDAVAAEVGMHEQLGDLRPVGLVGRRVVGELYRAGDPSAPPRDQQDALVRAHRGQHLRAPEGLALVFRVGQHEV